MVSKLGKVVTYIRKFNQFNPSHATLCTPGYMRLHDKLKYYISVTPIFMTIKPDRLVTIYNKEFLSIKSHVSFITWSSY